MQQQQNLDKNTPSDLSIAGRYINSLAGTYMAVAGPLVRYQSKLRGLNIEIEIDSLKEHKDFNTSFKISQAEINNLSALSKEEKDATICLDESKHLYRMTNQNSLIELDHVDVNLMMPTIDEALKNTEKIGPPIKIASRHELNLTGREKTLSLIARNDTFTGIINSAGEYFFDADHPEKAGAVTALLESCFFLKIGKERFTLELYRKENRYLLLTKVSIGTGIDCRMLETLTKQ